MERNEKFIILSAKKDKTFFKKILKAGYKKIKDLNNVKTRETTDDKKMIHHLAVLKKKFLSFGFFIDIIHYTERSGIKINTTLLKQLSRFNDARKKSFVAFLKNLKEITEKIAQRKKLKSKDLTYLTFNEIISFLKGKLANKKVDELQRRRKNKYIMEIINGKTRIIDDNFSNEYKKISKQFVKFKLSEEIKGVTINQGKIRGKVKIITQNDYKNIPPRSIIVTHQTKPDMTRYLKKAAAIVTDEGGKLCHAANVAREFKIPGVIGTGNATKFLKDDDLVEVDANNGVIKKLIKK